VELLAAIPRTEGLKEAKHEMIWKSYAASLLTLDEMKTDMAEITGHVIEHTTWCLSQQQLTPLVHFLDVLKILLQKDVAIVKGLHCLIGEWIGVYAATCRKTDVGRFLAIFIPMLKQIKVSGGMY